jgi:RNA polymerase sigma factor (sigma-70 family)
MESREQLVRALAMLGEQERQVYLLSAVDGLDQMAIATRLGIGVGEVEALLAEAIARLDQLL